MFKLTYSVIHGGLFLNMLWHKDISISEGKNEFFNSEGKLVDNLSQTGEEQRDEGD